MSATARDDTREPHVSSAEPHDHSAASFLRGLTLGAIIGAIIAGSSLWSRRRRRRASRKR